MRLDSIEAGRLARLFDDLLDVLSSDATAGPVQRRLFPAGYRDNHAAELEFRSLTEPSLRTERCERVRACAADLADLAGAPGELPLTDEAAQRWIQVLNDVRLVLGTQLDITEDDEPDIDPDDPQAAQRAIYYWLTGAQDSIVRVLMR